MAVTNGSKVYINGRVYSSRYPGRIILTYPNNTPPDTFQTGTIGEYLLTYYAPIPDSPECPPLDIYYSVLKQATATKECPVCEEGSEETLVIPSGTYSSLISQEDADNKAQAAADAGAQAHANDVGTCTPMEGFTATFVVDYDDELGYFAIASYSAGAVLPVTYLWSNGETTQQVNNLTSGLSYTVTVTDAVGCSASDTQVVGSP